MKVVTAAQCHDLCLRPERLQTNRAIVVPKPLLARPASPGPYASNEPTIARSHPRCPPHDPLQANACSYRLQSNPSPRPPPAVGRSPFAPPAHNRGGRVRGGLPAILSPHTTLRAPPFGWVGKGACGRRQAGGPTGRWCRHPLSEPPDPFGDGGAPSPSHFSIAGGVHLPNSPPTNRPLIKCPQAAPPAIPLAGGAAGHPPIPPRLCRTTDPFPRTQGTLGGCPP